MKKNGRPTKYKSEYCEKLIKFFDVEPYEERELPHYDKDGNVKWTDYKRMANKLPTLRNFAKSLKVNLSTPYEWIKKHKEFSNAFTQAQELRKWFLIENGLNGCYNPAFAIFVAKNITDMRDKQEIEHTVEILGKLLLEISDEKESIVKRRGTEEKPEGQKVEIKPLVLHQG